MSTEKSYQSQDQGIVCYDTNERFCTLRVIKYVCSTAEEAIALAEESRITRREIDAFAKKRTLQFHQDALSGNFSTDIDSNENGEEVDDHESSVDAPPTPL